MSVEPVWLDWMRCLDEIARLREAANNGPRVGAVAIGEGASDDVLARLAAVVGESWLGIGASCGALADEATLTVLAAITADGS